MNVIAQIIAAVHNFWAGLPLALQGALTLAFMAGVTFAMGYAFVIPAGWVLFDVGTWHLLYTPAAAFVVALWAVVYPILRDKVFPALLAWLVSLLKIQTASGKAAAPRRVWKAY